MVLATLLVLVQVAGCAGGRYPVKGRVVFDDGTPLDEGLVICEMQEGGRTVMARGKLNPDGTFQLGTERPGDGAPPGTYRVLVMPRGLTEAEANTRPPIIDKKFEKFETSGLTLVVSDRNNEVNITVTKPKNPRRP